MTRVELTRVTSNDSLAVIHERLAVNAFRRGFRLQGRELAHLQTWGLERVMRDASELLRRRVAPADPPNDGRQTPWRNHPVFVAQHATATCCRGCIEKWYGVARGHALEPDELNLLLESVRRWLEPYSRSG